MRGLAASIEASASRLKAIAADRAELERQQEAHRLAIAPVIEDAEMPEIDDIIAALAEHFVVSTETAEHWLRSIIWSKAA